MKHFLNEGIVKIFKNSVGDNSIKPLLKSKQIFSSLIHTKDFEKGGNIILKNKDTPLFAEDWSVYMILRSLCRTWIVTGKNMRDEKEMNFLNKLDLYKLDENCCKQLFGNESKLYSSNFDVNKNIVILSKSLTVDEVLTYECFKEQHSNKFILSNPNLNSQMINPNFLRENNIQIIEPTISKIDELYSYVTKIENSLPILAEVGPFTFNNILKGMEGQNKIDFILISVYEGDLKTECIGPNFPSKQDIEREYKLIHISDSIKCEKGKLTFYTFVKR